MVAGDGERRLLDFWRRLTDRQRANFLKLIELSANIAEADVNVLDAARRKVAADRRAQ